MAAPGLRERCRALRPRSLAPATIPILAALTLAFAAMAGCGGGDRTDATAPAIGEEVDLDVLVYNVEYGGGPATDRVIRAVDADVVGVLESYERLPAIARRTGYPYFNSSLQLLSKYPILEPSGGDGLYALIEVEPGYVVPFFNEHLDYVDWGPRALARGEPVESVIANENEVRTAALAEPTEAMSALIDAGYPVVLTGDFNEPSSLDYGEETVGTRKWIDEAVPWPVSEKLFDLGFSDSYREVHPDPVAVAGNTHRSGERIDLIYAAGPVETLDSKLVGERGGDDVDVEFAPWTSDHRAVLSSLRLTPVSMPTMVAVDARLADVGDELTVDWNNPGRNGNEIAIVAAGGEPDAAVETLPAPDSRGSAGLATDGWDAGRYEAVLVDDGGSEAARVSFDLRDPAAKLELTTDAKGYDEGEPIEVSWAGAPANRWDWLAVYRAAAADPATDDYMIWRYTGGHAAGTLPPTVAGSATLGPGSRGAPWPLPPGAYVVHYLLADQYESAGSAEFKVRDG